MKDFIKTNYLSSWSLRPGSLQGTLLDYFNLTQSMKEATHFKGCTLDLVLTCGFTLTLTLSIKNN